MAVIATALAGCAGGPVTPEKHARVPSAPGSSFGVPSSRAGPVSDGLPSAHTLAFQREIRLPWRKTDFSKHLVPLRQFERGGPAPDGIPPLDHPRVASIAAGSAYLTSRDPVIAVVAGGRARAYPLRILIWHEIVNDVLGGNPIAVTYCPLCNSAEVFDRRVRGHVLRFGTTGNVRGSNLVMWDRRTESWWQQIGGEALVGAYAGTRLHQLPAETLSWADFKRRHPRGEVLSRHTGFRRPYGTNPYVGYDDPNGEPRFSNLRTDPRLPPLERVAAVTVARKTIVVPFSKLARDPVAQAWVGGRPAVVFYDRRVASVLDARRIAGSREVGTATAFDRRVRGRTLDFAADGPGTFTDLQTGSTWDLTGQATAGPLRGAGLRPVRSDDQFWFAVAAFYPRARIVG